MNPEESVFSARFTSVAAAILAAVEGGILPPGSEVRNPSAFSSHALIPPGRMPVSTAGKIPAATLNTFPNEDAPPLPGPLLHPMEERVFLRLRLRRPAK
jgi:hypothetical protein